MSRDSELTTSQIDDETVTIRKLMEQDDFPVAKAVEEIVALCVAAAASPQEDALESHSNTVVGNIYSIALERSPYQQSKLVDFTNLLQQQIVLDPKTGEAVGGDNRAFWIGMPGLSLIIAEHNVRDEINTEQRRNFAAFLAQLYEAESKWFSILGAITYSQLAWPFEVAYNFSRNTVHTQVQVACMWLIYAPYRVWTNIDQGLQTSKGTFKYAHWERLRQVMQHSQGEYLDECTQNLIWRALISMQKTEKEAVKGGTKGSK